MQLLCCAFPGMCYPRVYVLTPQSCGQTMCCAVLCPCMEARACAKYMPMLTQTSAACVVQSCFCIAKALPVQVLLASLYIRACSTFQEKKSHSA